MFIKWSIKKTYITIDILKYICLEIRKVCLELLHWDTSVWLCELKKRRNKAFISCTISFLYSSCCMEVRLGVLESRGWLLSLFPEFLCVTKQDVDHKHETRFWGSTLVVFFFGELPAPLCVIGSGRFIVLVVFTGCLCQCLFNNAFWRTRRRF